MYACAKMKRVTDPLDDKVKALITGRNRIGADSACGGSQHTGGAGDDVTSSFSEIFFTYEDSSSPESTESDSERDRSVCDSILRNADLIKSILMDRTDEFENVLEEQVLKAVEVFSCSRSDKQLLLRNVMPFLRESGYDAAICKTRWKSSGGVTAGNYEFIDVARNIYDSSVRYVVDLDFAAEFEIARPTSAYQCLLKHLPTVFVGKSDDLKQILKAMSDAAKRSLKIAGLHLPPWRKHRFMLNKWIGPYHRTVNLSPTSFSSLQSCAVKCRAVGFNAAVNSDRLLCPSTART